MEAAQRRHSPAPPKRFRQHRLVEVEHQLQLQAQRQLQAQPRHQPQRQLVEPAVEQQVVAEQAVALAEVLDNKR